MRTGKRVPNKRQQVRDRASDVEYSAAAMERARRAAALCAADCLSCGLDVKHARVAFWRAVRRWQRAVEAAR